jgi:hypothetical protein
VSDDTQNAWVERVLGISVPSSSPQDADAFADLGELGIGALDIWTAARGAFDTANEAVDQQITTVVAALHASDDPELQEIGDMGLNGLTENVKVPLIAALIEAGTANIKTVAVASPKVLAAVAAFRGKITSDPKILACDDNPLGVYVDIAGTFGTALDQIEDALSIAH